MLSVQARGVQQHSAVNGGHSQSHGETGNPVRQARENGEWGGEGRGGGSYVRQATENSEWGGEGRGRGGGGGGGSYVRQARENGEWGGEGGVIRTTGQREW